MMKRFVIAWKEVATSMCGTKVTDGFAFGSGDLIILPAGSYHWITLNTSNYVKLMRLFIGEPVWTAYNRPQEDNLARKEYMKGLKQRGSDEHEKNRESKGVSEISANSPR